MSEPVAITGLARDPIDDARRLAEQSQAAALRVFDATLQDLAQAAVRLHEAQGLQHMPPGPASMLREAEVWLAPFVERASAVRARFGK